jgi:hypothetical protein
LQSIDPAHTVEDKMKLSIEAELVYNFAKDTQIIANLEASRAGDQIILSESLDIQPPGTSSFRHHPLRRSADTRFARWRGCHQVQSGRREQPSAVASSVRMSTRVV